ncbi:hypothetical protein NX720_06400 [Endozoicomonas euniceicola]|uniref:Uncharacterized protein n=1 Tax=Endozoicomonas euniceicola TaxID=1234143 RepID=A0ABY6GXM9_9GAMM|nr:hypothetical protein [Endozoicomonas euniceicola]UYM17543.1 hypothetical protein NX720_06400 [Endozoicomonas euniceicola]
MADKAIKPERTCFNLLFFRAINLRIVLTDTVHLFFRQHFSDVHHGDMVTSSTFPIVPQLFGKVNLLLAGKVRVKVGSSNTLRSMATSAEYQRFVSGGLQFWRQRNRLLRGGFRAT